MSPGHLLRRAVLGTVVAAALSFAVPALASAATSGVVSSFSVTPTSTQAGSDASITTNIGFSYGSPTDTVNEVRTTLPPGLLASPANVPATCSSSDLAANTCPSGSLIGTGSGTTTPDLGPVTINLYLMAAPSSSDVAGLGAITYISGTPAATSTGALDIVTDSNGGPVGELSLGVPTTLQVNTLSFTINGTTSNSAAFTRLPTNCSNAATTSVSVDTVSSTNDGTGSDSFTPTGCSSLSFSPTISGSAVKDSGDSGARVTTLLSQPASGQSAISGITLSVPETVLAPNTGALALAGSTTPVGTATAATPLLSTPLTGQVFLTECTTAGPTCVSGLGLSIRFPAPTAFNLNGSVALTGSVSFGNVPDVPLTALAVVLNGGPQALFVAPCAATSGTLSAAFSGQNGATLNASSPFAVSGCPATTTVTTGTTAGKPKASGGSLTGLASRHPKLHFTVSHGSDAPGIKTVSVGLPSGLSFHSSKVCSGKGKKRKCTTKVKGLSVSGGTVKSAKISGGRLVITLKSAANSVSVTVKGPGLTETKGLQTKVKKHKTKSLTVSIKVTDAKGTGTGISLKLKV